MNVQFQKISIPPPPPTEGQWKFRGGGGLKGGNFRGVGGCAYEEFLQRVRKFTKKSKARPKVVIRHCGKIYSYYPEEKQRNR